MATKAKPTRKLKAPSPALSAKADKLLKDEDERAFLASLVTDRGVLKEFSGVLGCNEGAIGGGNCLRQSLDLMKFNLCLIEGFRLIRVRAGLEQDN